ncbi:MAG: hypothetical protein L6R39_001325 [Caloplaca ligustica]|nr:MAG: hypothetical protein L6R39_001325 [Caloplaca ligustica]
MTSMLPTSAGQYHWVAELAPIRYAKSLSYIAGTYCRNIQCEYGLTRTGMITGFARLSIAASAAYVAATEIQGLLTFNIESYVSHNWHGTLIYWAILLVAALVNILGIRFFPHIETLAFVHHVCFFFVFLVPLVYLSPQSTASFVFANFENAGGWESNGISWGIGLLASAWAFVGIDGTSHMSEEVRNSENVVPQSMVIAFFISGAMAFGASVAILFSVGDLKTILSTSTNYPIIQIFYTATQSKAATTVIISGLMLTSVFSTFGLLASASRLTWALARDNTFPLARYFAHVGITSAYGWSALTM